MISRRPKVKSGRTYTQTKTLPDGRDSPLWGRNSDSLSSHFSLYLPGLGPISFALWAYVCVFCKCVRMLACSCRPPGATLVFPVNLWFSIQSAFYCTQTNIHSDTHLQVPDEYSISRMQASVPAHTDLSCRGYVTYSVISNDLKSQVLAVLD